MRVYVKSNQTYVSKFEGNLFNFKYFCPKSVLRFFAVLVCGLKLCGFDGFRFLRFAVSNTVFYCTLLCFKVLKHIALVLLTYLQFLCHIGFETRNFFLLARNETSKILFHSHKLIR